MMVGLACLGAGFIAVAAYAAQFGRGDVIQRAAVVATSVPVGLGLAYLGVGGLVVLVMGRSNEG